MRFPEVHFSATTECKLSGTELRACMSRVASGPAQADSSMLLV